MAYFLCIILYFQIFGQLFAQNDRYDGTLVQHEQTIRELVNINKEARRKLQEQEDEMKLLKLELEVMKKQQSLNPAPAHEVPGSGFLAVQTATQDVGPQATIKFETVKFNRAPENFGYDPRISFFRVPFEGVYVFFTNVRLGSGTPIEAAIVEDHRVQSATYCRPYSSYYNSCSAMAIIASSAGEDVWVKNPTSSTYRVYSNSLGAPENGIYVFYVNIRGGSSSYQHQASIVRERDAQVSTYCYPYNGYYISCSAMAAVYLDRGNDVWVRNANTAASLMRLISDRKGYTHFWGFLLTSEKER